MFFELRFESGEFLRFDSPFDAIFNACNDLLETGLDRVGLFALNEGGAGPELEFFKLSEIPPLAAYAVARVCKLKIGDPGSSYAAGWQGDQFRPAGEFRTEEIECRLGIPAPILPGDQGERTRVFASAEARQAWAHQGFRSPQS